MAIKKKIVTTDFEDFLYLYKTLEIKSLTNISGFNIQNFLF